MEYLFKYESSLSKILLKGKERVFDLVSLLTGTSQFNLNLGALKGVSFCAHPNTETKKQTGRSILKIIGNKSFKM
jgi:hypothetical protein